MTRSLSQYGFLYVLMGLNITAGMANWAFDPAHWLNWLAGMMGAPVLFAIVYASTATKALNSTASALRWEKPNRG